MGKLDIDIANVNIQLPPCDVPIYRVQLIKLKEADNPHYPGNIPEGYVVEGYVPKGYVPVVGQPYYVSGTLAGFYRTSIVEEVFEDGTFRTMNSVYRVNAYEEGLSNGWTTYEKVADLAPKAEHDSHRRYQE